MAARFSLFLARYSLSYVAFLSLADFRMSVSVIREHHLAAQQLLIAPLFTLSFKVVLRHTRVEFQDQFYLPGDAVAINRFGQDPVDVAELIDRAVGAAPKTDVLQGDQDIVEIGVRTIALAPLNLEKKTDFGRLMSGIPKRFRGLLRLRRITGH